VDDEYERGVNGAVTALWEWFVGRPMALPTTLVARHPALGDAQWRRGGLPPRVGGWALGRRTVLGIAVGRTVFLAPNTELDAALLLHEVAHVHQFQRVPGFVLRYLWESVRRGYAANRFEREADAYAARALLIDPSYPAQSASASSSIDSRVGISDIPFRGV
jgi:hypothetical protein